MNIFKWNVRQISQWELRNVNTENYRIKDTRTEWIHISITQEFGNIPYINPIAFSMGNRRNKILSTLHWIQKRWQAWPIFRFSLPFKLLSSHNIYCYVLSAFAVLFLNDFFLDAFSLQPLSLVVGICFWGIIYYCQKCDTSFK